MGLVFGADPPATVLNAGTITSHLTVQIPVLFLPRLPALSSVIPHHEVYGQVPFAQNKANSLQEREAAGPSGENTRKSRKQGKPLEEKAEPVGAALKFALLGTVAVSKWLVWLAYY